VIKNGPRGNAIGTLKVCMRFTRLMTSKGGISTEAKRQHSGRVQNQAIGDTLNLGTDRVRDQANLSRSSEHV